MNTPAKITPTTPSPMVRALLAKYRGKSDAEQAVDGAVERIGRDITRGMDRDAALGLRHPLCVFGQGDFARGWTPGGGR